MSMVGPRARLSDALEGRFSLRNPAVWTAVDLTQAYRHVKCSWTDRTIIVSDLLVSLIFHTMIQNYTMIAIMTKTLIQSFALNSLS